MGLILCVFFRRNFGHCFNNVAEIHTCEDKSNHFIIISPHTSISTNQYCIMYSNLYINYECKGPYYYHFKLPLIFL